MQTGQDAAASSDAGLDDVARCKAEFEAGMDDDLNMPKALAALHRLRGLALEKRLGASSAAAALQFLRRANDVLGCIRLDEELLSDTIERAIAARQDARKRKDFKESDRIRDELLGQGIVLEDTPSGVVWKRRS
jgi:cysteinyl-tRNA synthetase